MVKDYSQVTKNTKPSGTAERPEKMQTRNAKQNYFTEFRISKLTGASSNYKLKEGHQ